MTEKIVKDMRTFLVEELKLHENVRKDRNHSYFQLLSGSTIYLPLEVSEDEDYTSELSMSLTILLFKTPNFWAKKLVEGDDLENTHFWAKTLHSHLKHLSIRNPDGYFNDYVLFRKKL